MGISYRLERLLFERTIYAAKKPCRVNIQFATIRTARQLAAPFWRIKRRSADASRRI